MISENISAEAALFADLKSRELFTVLPCVIRDSTAAMAENCLARPTPYAVPAHMNGCGRAHRITLIVFRVVIYLALCGLHHSVALRTFDDILSLAHKEVHLAFFDLFDLCC